MLAVFVILAQSTQEDFAPVPNSLDYSTDLLLSNLFHGLCVIGLLRTMSIGFLKYACHTARTKKHGITLAWKLNASVTKCANINSIPEKRDGVFILMFS